VGNAFWSLTWFYFKKSPGVTAFARRLPARDIDATPFGVGYRSVVRVRAQEGLPAPLDSQSNEHD
jgi:hypothetical protein